MRSTVEDGPAIATEQSRPAGRIAAFVTDLVEPFGCLRVAGPPEPAIFVYRQEGDSEAD